MKRFEMKFIKFIVYLSSILSLIIVFISFSLNAHLLFKLFSTITGSITTISSVYIKWLWKIKWLNIFSVPNLNGKYTCYIRYKDLNKNIEKEKVTTATIIQDLLNIQINLETDEVDSYSFSSEIIDDHGYKYLYYMYKSVSHKETRNVNPDKLGAVWLRINSKKELKGEYFTNVGSTGTMILKKN